jgi:hypothetical protein
MKLPQTAVLLKIGEIQFDRAAPQFVQCPGFGGLHPLPQGVEELFREPLAP